MRLFLSFIMASLSLCGALMGQSINPPAKLQLPSNLATAGTTTTVNGAAWAYVVWLPSDVAWMAARDIVVTLKPAAADAAGTYTAQGTVGVVDDPAVIKILISRAGALGDNLTECADIASQLIKEWSTTPNPTVPPALENRISMLVKRAQQSEFHAGSLRQLGQAHPLFRLVMGLAWAGPLGVANGQDAAIELRAKLKSTGGDAGVVGRLTLRAGAIDANTLAAPGVPVQVLPALLATLPTTPETTLNLPFSNQSADLGMQMRWAVPEALRRQVLLTRGFHVWRVKQGYTPPGGLNGAGLTAAEAIPANVTRITRNPAVAKKLFRSVGSGETGLDVTDFVADPTTFFITDDNQRYNTSPANPKLITGTPYAEEARYDYVVAGVDLLGRIGPVSPRGEGIACRTVPPTVPDVVRVDNLVIGSSPRLRVVWKPNPAVINGSGVVSTTHYLIFRDRLQNTAALTDDLQRIQDPTQHNNLIFIGSVAQPASTPASGVLTFDDPMLPATDDYGRTYFYSIRSVHQSSCGYLPSSPSPPVFGTFRDRVGPPTPVGNVFTQCPRVGVQALGVTSTTNISTTSGKTALRLAGLREDKDVQWFEFRVQLTDGPTPTWQNLPRLYFSTGDSVWLDTLAPWQAPRGVVEARAGLASGRFSHWVSYDTGAGLSASQRTTLSFTARSRATINLVPDDNTTPDYWEQFLPGPPSTVTVTNGLDGAKIAAISSFPAAVGTREFVIQAQRVGVWAVVAGGSALLSSNQLVFRDTFPTAATAYRIWQITDPIGTPSSVVCDHDPRPEGITQVMPISVWLKIPAGAREYRIYRRVNDGALTLLQQGAGDYDSSIVQTVIYDDPSMPNYGGTITYYGQAFDDNGNPSALAVLGTKVGIEPELPKATLDTLEPTGSVAAPTMRVHAVCPSPGVQRLEIHMTPDPLGPSGMTPTTPLGSNPVVIDNGIPFNYATTLLSPISSSAVDQPISLNQSFSIKAGVEYSVQVRAISASGKTGAWSELQTMTWTAPIVAGEVPWPARTLPPVINWNDGLRAFEITPAMMRATDGDFLPRTADTYPVGIRLGSIPLNDPLPQYQQGVFQSANWDMLQRVDFTESIRFGNFAWADGSLDLLTQPDTVEQKLFRRMMVSGDISYEVEKPALLPVVLYRQQIGWGTVASMIPLANADVVQVSPLITRIESAVSVSDDRNFRAIQDPFVNIVFVHNPANGINPVQADLCLFDTNPVVYGAVYAYYLVHFEPRGEIDYILNAGTLAITQP